jgi:hypothetical protein
MPPILVTTTVAMARLDRGRDQVLKLSEKHISRSRWR